MQKEWSLLIPAFNEERHIADCLEALCNQDYPLSQIEVIIVDNGSSDGTLEVAKSFMNKLDIVIRVAPNVSIAALRNLAVDIATADKLAFLDSDCVVAPNWLSLAASLLAKHPDSIIGAFYAAPPDANWSARLWHQYVHRPRTGPVSYVPSSNLILSRSTFKDIEGFNEQLKTNEDSHICAKARAEGHSILAFPALAVIHLGAERNLLEFVKRQFWHGSSILSRTAIQNNMKAIGLAAYTLTLLIWTILAVLTGRPIRLPITLMFVAPSIIVSWRLSRHGRVADAPALFVLVVMYSLARAVSLPFAVINGVKTAWR
jgi:glycosyltransferase involved in cell wall biosynthesis